MSQVLEKFKPHLLQNIRHTAEIGDAGDATVDIYSRSDGYYLSPFEGNDGELAGIPNIYQRDINIWEEASGRGAPVQHIPLHHIPAHHIPVHHIPVHHIEPNGHAPSAVPMGSVHRLEPRPPRTNNMRRSSAAPNPYWIGQATARLLTGAGWLVMVVGLALPLVSLVPALAVRYSMLNLVVGAVGALLLGLLIVTMGHAARALFDQANTARNQAAALQQLIAIERTRMALEHS